MPDLEHLLEQCTPALAQQPLAAPITYDDLMSLADQIDGVNWVDSYRAPAPEMPPVLTIHDHDNRPIVALFGDGRVEYPPGVDMDEAARIFWAAVLRAAPFRP